MGKTSAAQWQGDIQCREEVADDFSLCFTSQQSLSSLAPGLQLIQIYSTILYKADLKETVEVVKVVRLLKRRQENKQITLKKRRKQTPTSRCFADTCDSYSKVIINVADFPPTALSLSRRANFFKATIWRLDAAEFKRLQRWGWQQGIWFTYQPRQHFSTTPDKPRRLQIHHSLNSHVA